MIPSACFRRLSRLCLTPVCGSILLPALLYAEMQIDTNNKTTSFLYSEYQQYINSPLRGTSSTIDYDILEKSLNDLKKAVASNPEIDKCLKDVLPAGAQYSMQDVYNKAMLTVTLHAKKEDIDPKTNRSKKLRGATELNGKDISLYGDGIADSVNFRWKRLNSNGMPLNAHLQTEEKLWKSQMATSLFHESGHWLLLKNFPKPYADAMLPEPANFSWKKFLDYLISLYSNDLDSFAVKWRKKEDIKVLHEAFAVYCNYLYYKYIEKRKGINTISFMADTLKSDGKEYGIGVDYMWRYSICLDYSVPGANDGKPRRDLYEAYLDQNKRGDVSWAQKYKIEETWYNNNKSAAKNSQINTINGLMSQLAQSQAKTLNAPNLPQLSPAQSAHSTK